MNNNHSVMNCWSDKIIYLDLFLDFQLNYLLSFCRNLKLSLKWNIKMLKKRNPNQTRDFRKTNKISHLYDVQHCYLNSMDYFNNACFFFFFFLVSALLWDYSLCWDRWKQYMTPTLDTALLCIVHLNHSLV